MSNTPPINGAPRFLQLYDQASNLGATGHLRAAHDPVTGETKLFKRPGADGLLGRLYNVIFGRGDLKRYVDKALQEVQPLAAESAEVRNAVAAIRKETRRAGHDARMDVIASHLNTIRTAAGERRAPSLADVAGMKERDGAMEQVASHLNFIKSSGGTVSRDKVVPPLVNGLVACLRKTGEEVAFSFMVSRGEALKKELLTELEAGTGLPLVDNPDMRKLVDEAYEAAMQEIGGRVTEFSQVNVSGGKGRAPGKVVSEIRSFSFGGTDFKRERSFGGGMGVAELFKGSDGRQLIVKYPIPNGRSKDEDFEDIAVEATAQRGANRAAPGKFGTLESILRLPDGRIAIVMEYLPHGEVGEVPTRLAAADHLSQNDKRRVLATLVKDMLESTDALHRDAGIAHVDLKGPNFLIGADGKARLVDFGTARKGNWRTLLRGMPNLRWADPLAGAAHDKVVEAVNVAKSPYMAQIEKLREKNRARLISIAKDTSLSDEARAHRVKQANDELKDAVAAVNEKAAKVATKIERGFQLSGMGADSWGLGVSIFEHYTGRPLFNGTPDQIREEQRRFMNMADRRDRAAFVEKAGLPDDVPQDIKDMIVDFLNPQAPLRMTAAEALGKPIFKDAALGSARVRDDIRSMPTAPAKWGATRDKAADATNAFIGSLMRRTDAAAAAELTKVAGDLARLSSAGDLLAATGTVGKTVDDMMLVHVADVLGTAQAGQLHDDASRAKALGLTDSRYQALKRELSIHVIQTALDAIGDSQDAILTDAVLANLRKLAAPV